jgi:hypothetical protein
MKNENWKMENRGDSTPPNNEHFAVSIFQFSFSISPCSPCRRATQLPAAAYHSARSLD